VERREELSFTGDHRSQVEPVVPELREGERSQESRLAVTDDAPARPGLAARSHPSREHLPKPSV